MTAKHQEGTAKVSGRGDVRQLCDRKISLTQSPTQLVTDKGSSKTAPTGLAHIPIYTSQVIGGHSKKYKDLSCAALRAPLQTLKSQEHTSSAFENFQTLQKV